MTSIPTIGETAEKAIIAWVAASSGLGSSKVAWADQNGERVAAPYITVRVAENTPIGQPSSTHATKPLELASDIVEAIDTSANTLTLTGHAYETGDGPVQFECTGAISNGLALERDYWIIVDGADTVQLAESYTEAIDGDALDLTAGTTTGTLTIAGTDETLRAGQEITHTLQQRRRVIVEVTCYAASAVTVGRATEILDAVAMALDLPSTRRALETASISPPVLESMVSVGGAFKVAVFEPRAIARFLFHFTASATEDGGIIETTDPEIELV